MYRATPKIIVLLAIGLVVGAIYYVTRSGQSAGPHDPGIVYIDTGIGTK